MPEPKVQAEEATAVVLRLTQCGCNSGQPLTDHAASFNASTSLAYERYIFYILCICVTVLFLGKQFPISINTVSMFGIWKRRRVFCLMWRRGGRSSHRLRCGDLAATQSCFHHSSTKRGKNNLEAIPGTCLGVTLLFWCFGSLIIHFCDSLPGSARPSSFEQNDHEFGLASPEQPPQERLVFSSTD